VRAVVVGSGPNGLAAAIALARRGVAVTVYEAEEALGGGLRSEALTLPGFVHDVCAAVFPMALASPFFRELSLDVEWVRPPVAVAHPFLDGTAAAITRSVSETAATLGADGDAYRRVFEPLVEHAEALWPELLSPLHVPKHPWMLARFGLDARHSGKGFAEARFRTERARALFAGCAAHAFLPLTKPFSSAVGIVLALSAHTPGFSHAIGGAARLAASLVAVASKLGVEFVTGERVTTMSSLPEARGYLFDTAPMHLAEIAGDRLPERYRRRLRDYRYGPSAFKIDWALSEPIPWRAPECRAAATVHVGGTLEEIASAEAMISRGESPEHPFILVAQPSAFDPTRAPEGRHTGWAYAHVPFASERDWTESIEARIESFAPGFRDTILARHVLSPAALEAHDANAIGGHILGGVADFAQLFARPVRWVDPYATPDPALFICSASTPPGAGVHGMCGYHAARSALARRFKD
jgi:phytoene dehydrogenase-like protein